MISIITRIIVVVVRTVCNCQFCSRFTAKLSEDYSLARTQTCPNFLGPQNSSLSLCKIRLHKFAGANFASAFRCVAFRSEVHNNKTVRSHSLVRSTRARAYAFASAPSSQTLVVGAATEAGDNNNSDSSGNNNNNGAKLTALHNTHTLLRGPLSLARSLIGSLCALRSLARLRLCSQLASCKRASERAQSCAKVR